jgi:DnaJ-class molecular chaperone
MVKADLTRDYYVDLGLQPGASEAEIKKQFRVLGTKSTPLRWLWVYVC